MSYAHGYWYPSIQTRSGAVGGPPPNPDFVFTVETTGAPEPFTIPCQNSGTFNATINWGDGAPDSTITDWDDPDLAHAYTTAGTHTITVSGTFPNIYFNNLGDKLKVRTVENLGSVGWLRLNSAFYGCASMTSFVGGDTDTSNVTTLALMFYNASSATVLDVSGFDTPLVTSMAQMFRGASSVTALDVSGFDTSLVISMAHAFRSVSGLTTSIDISSWGIGSLTNGSSMLLGATALDTAIYDATLVNWQGQLHQPNVTIHFDTSEYTAGGAAEAARAALVANGWVITDGGPV